MQTACWVPRNAIGPSALVALACDKIFLHPKSRIGAVSNLGPRDDAEAERQFLGQTMRSLADSKGRPSGILLAMALHQTKVFEVQHRETGDRSYRTAEDLQAVEAEWIVGPMLPESGAGLLSLTAPREAELGISAPPVDDLEAVKLSLSLGANAKLQLVQRGWVDDLLFLLNRRSVTALLFVVAFVCIYLEMQMNVGILGIASILCFALFFWSRFLGGTAGSLEVLLFLLGLASLALEIFAMPGFGMFGVTGGVLIVVSMVMASQTFGSIEYGRDLEQTFETLKVMAASFLTVIGLVVLMSRYLPRLPFMESMILIPPGEDGELVDDVPRLKPELLPGDALIGLKGVAETDLRPSGKASIEGRLVDVMSNGPFVTAGSKVEVIKVSGSNLIVREV